MAARKTAKDIAQMTPEEKAQYEKRLETNRAPRPAYLGYTLDANGRPVVAVVTRSAEEMLAAKDKNPEIDYLRFEIK